MAATPKPPRWNVLISAATLGTTRAPLAPELTQLGDGSPLPAAAAPTALLRAAAAWDLWQIAGTRSAPSPAATDATPDVAGTTSRAAQISEPACWRFARMLSGERRELVGEWLQYAAATRAVLPVHWLPVALGQLQPDERNRNASLLGPRAAWLAGLNPEWQLVATTAEPSEERWQTGTLAEREAALIALRNIDPGRARAWIESTWTEDPAEAREVFLRALRVGLSADDEALLELGLDDKRKGVRQAAADCLIRLPGSAHAARNLARLRPLITLSPAEKNLLGRPRKRVLDVQLPAAPDKAALRDGVEAKPPAGRTLGERSFWLMQMVARVPPAFWSRTYDCTPEVFLEAAAATDHAAELLIALSDAAALHPDDAWLSALCVSWLERSEKLEPGLRSQYLATLIVAAPPATQRSLMQRVLTALGPKEFHLAQSIVASINVSWDVEITRLALRMLAETIRKDTQKWSMPRNLLSDWALRADVETAAAPTAAILESLADNSVWRGALETFAETLEFRHSMKKELLS